MSPSRPLLLIALFGGCGLPDAGVGLDEPVGPAFFDTLPSEQAGPPAPLVMCKPPKVIPGEVVEFMVSGLRPGETARFLRGRGTGGSLTCFPSAGGLCTDLINPVLMGFADANANGVASLTRVVPPDLQGGLLYAAQAFVKRGSGGSSSAASNAVTFHVLGSSDEPGECGDADVCPNLPDSDGDGVNDVCDACPSFDDFSDADGDSVADQCDEVNVSPGSLSYTMDSGDEQTQTLTLENVTGDAIGYAATTTCGWLTVSSGGPVPGSGTIPSGGAAQLSVIADAQGLVADIYGCDVVITTDHPVYANLDTIEVSLEVTPPGFDIVFPSDATTPTGIDDPISVTVTDETGAAAAGMQVTFAITGDAQGVVFAATGTTTHTLTTDSAGNAATLLDAPSTFEGEVSITATIFDPVGGVIIGEVVFVRNWDKTSGNIYFWEIFGGVGGNILKMPADFSVGPVVFDGTSYDGNCSGCHTVSPTVLPTTGRGALFVQDRVTMYEQIIDVDTKALLFTFAGDSSDSDWSPDSTRVTWSNHDLQIFDITTGASTAVSGAANPSVLEVFPTFSSNGSHIAYTECVGCSWEHSSGALSILGGSSSIRTIPSGGGSSAELIPAQAGYAIYYPEFSPDGRWLVYNKSRTTAGGGGTPSSYSSSTSELWIVAVDPDGSMVTGTPRRLDHANGSTAFANSWPTWAPDSSFIAFASSRLGTWDLFFSAISTTGVDSPAVTQSYMSGPNGQHIPSWGP